MISDYVCCLIHLSTSASQTRLRDFCCEYGTRRNRVTYKPKKNVLILLCQFVNLSRFEDLDCGNLR